MSESNYDIKVDLDGNAVLTVFLVGENASSLINKRDDAAENGEALYQIYEGCFYEYQLSDKNYLLEPSEIVSHSKFNTSSGRIAPNIYVGTLSINILEESTGNKCGTLKLEVQSKKTTYREDYRKMLSDITDKCVDLLLQPNSPVTTNIEIDFNTDAKTLYQRFAFVKSVIESEEFTDSIHKVLSAPVTKWQDEEIERDLRSVRKIGSKAIKQFATSTNRIRLPEFHSMRRQGILDSAPARIRTSLKRDTVDTLENRFIKFALSSFLNFCSDILNRCEPNTRIHSEANALINTLDQHLTHPVFKEVSQLMIIPLNSPVLQRKEGYREILRAWLMFDLAAKLVWHGGDDVFDGGKRDVATLYEYWLFFKLLDIIKEVFHVEPKSIDQLIGKTNDGLGLQLKQGKHLAIEGVFESNSRKLNVQFSYNRTFSGGNEYPKGGSWSRDLRPDYTLSLWPCGILQEQAELEELMVHVHFDAKYRVEKLSEIIDGSENDLNVEKQEQNKGTYKRADLLKMHAYRDAIRRTVGAYVLYPGDKSQKIIGFHEILPGLGAFAISPDNQNNGGSELKIFLNEIVQHFLNRTTQREKMSFRTYETHKERPSDMMNELLPEAYGDNRGFLPDEAYVLVGFFKSEAHRDWILKHKLYNARTGATRGSLRLNSKIAGAKYILLHGEDRLKTSLLFKLNTDGPRIFSKSDMIEKDYPEPSQNFYLVFDLKGETESELLSYTWDLNLLEEYKHGRGSALPFVVSLKDLFRSKC